jgi:hypothetical protein
VSAAFVSGDAGETGSCTGTGALTFRGVLLMTAALVVDQSTS